MNILLLGDIMLDINYICEVKRNAPEANIPVYNTIKTTYNLGGAGNVAINFKNLNCNIEIISKVGNDYGGNKIREILDSCDMKHKLFVTNSQTTIKNRIFHNSQIVNRHDIEDITPINNIIENEILDYIFSLKDIHAIVLSDYNKGLMSIRLITQIIQYANENDIYTFVDPKINDIIKYKDCFCFKPNYFESKTITNNENINEMFGILKEKYHFKNIVITDGENGMYINDIHNHIKHKNKINIVDITGSGDIVLTVIVYVYLKERDLLKACKIANYVAGKGTTTIGNYHISINDLDEYVENIVYDYEIEKIKNIRKLSNNIIFTNGCFDIIHSAHIKLLHYCKNQGDLLVVGLNSDNSIKKIKGESRPINKIIERCELLKHLYMVDYIIIFDDETPLKIIEYLRPNTIVKGGDYTVDTVIGKEYCESVLLYNYINGVSSTNIINKIKNQ
jgi:D-beta-D-heptose 7-phosphate kinase/D-beta-D-heptose 1-phosphate adenosyltransferase